MWASGQCFKGLQRQHTSCSAAPSRSATQAGTRAATRQQPSQSAQAELVIEQQCRRHVRLADGAGAGTVGAQSAGVDGVHVCLSHANPGTVSGAEAVSASHHAPVLLPSALDGVAEQSTVCFTANGHVNGHARTQLQSTPALHHHAHHAQQPHHRRRPSDGVEAAHFHPQLGRGASANGSGHDRNANGSSNSSGPGRGVNGVRLQLSQQEQEQQQSHGLSLAPRRATATDSNGAAQGLLGAEQVQQEGEARDGLAASAVSLHHKSGSWVSSRSRHCDPDHTSASYSAGTDGSVMPSYLDAASRSSGVASTSGPGRSGSGHSAAHTRSSTGGRSAVSATSRLASAAAAAAVVSSAAGVGAGRVPLELAERMAAAVAADAVPHPSPAWGGAGKGANSHEGAGGSGASRRGSGSNGAGDGTGAELSPWHPEAELLPPSALDQLPEGDERYAADEHAWEDQQEEEEEEQEDAAGRPGRRRRSGRRSNSDSNGSEDLLEAPQPRRPRHPSRAEHRMLRQQAAVQQLALRPRAPAPEDLRLTSRLMTTTHWSQLLPLLADHAEAHERRQHQQQQQRTQVPRGGRGGASDSGSRSRAHSPAGRSGRSKGSLNTTNGSNSSGDDGASGPGNWKGAAGLNALAAAAAAAASGHVPVAALPYTAQHVAAALQRTAQLVEHGAGPASAADARRLHGLVDCLARLAAALLPSPGMGLREITSVFHSLVRLRHPVGKPFYIALMTAARKRFATAAASTAMVPAATAAAAAPEAAAAPSADRVSARDSSSSGAAAAAAEAAAGTAHDLAQLVWCVAACGMSGLRADWAAAYAAALKPVAPALAPKGVAMVLYGLARLRSPPPPALLGELCAQLLRHMEAAGAALEGASVDGSDWEAVKACASRCAEEERQRVRSAQQQQPQAQPQAVAAGGSGADSAALYSSSGGSSSSSSSSSGHCRPVDVSLSLWALATLRLPPGGFCPRLLPAAERYSLAHLPDFPQQELSNLLWALARLQHRPSPAFMAGLYDTTAVLLPELQPQALSTLLYSLAQMRPGGVAPPEQAWLAAAAGRAAEALPGFGPQSLALTVYGLAVLGYRPQDSWLHAFHSHLEAQRSGVDVRVRDKVREAYRLMAFRPAGPAGAGAGSAAAAAAGAEPHGARGGFNGSAGAAQGPRRAGLGSGSSTGAAPGLRAAPSRWQAPAAPADGRAPPPAPEARLAGRPDGRQSTAAPGAGGGAPQPDDDAAASTALEAADVLDAAGVVPHPAEDAAASAPVSVLVRPSRFGF